MKIQEASIGKREGCRRVGGKTSKQASGQPSDGSGKQFGHARQKELQNSACL